MHVARLTRDFTDVELGFARTMVSCSHERGAVRRKLPECSCLSFTSCS